MILEKLLQSENEAKHTIKITVRKMAAIKSFRKLLEQIDFSSEVVPLEDKEKLIELMTSLKGSVLEKYEILLIEELTIK